MAESARAQAGAAPLCHDLPEAIIIWEILVRLGPKAIIRCRAVCTAWLRATSSRDFLLAHHARQPNLPLLSRYNSIADDGVASLDIITFDGRAGLLATDRLQSVTRLSHTMCDLGASCDGLLVFSDHLRRFCICNPATRQYSLLPQINGFIPLGMYPHSPTGEYRLLLYWLQVMRCENSAYVWGEGSYVFALDSGQAPRHIGCLEGEEVMFPFKPLMFRGSLHWPQSQEENGSNMIMIFDSIAESFRQMNAPVVPGHTSLFEMDGMLGMSSLSYEAKTYDIWLMQDYEVWTYKCRVELLAPEMRTQFEKCDDFWTMVAPSCDGGVMFLVQFGEWLLQVDINGQLVDSFPHRGIPTQHLFKPSLVSHTFFPTLEGNTSPFI